MNSVGSSIYHYSLVVTIFRISSSPAFSVKDMSLHRPNAAHATDRNGQHQQCHSLGKLNAAITPRATAPAFEAPCNSAGQQSLATTFTGSHAATPVSSSGGSREGREGRERMEAARVSRPRVATREPVSSMLYCFRLLNAKAERLFNTTRYFMYSTVYMTFTF